MQDNSSRVEGMICNRWNCQLTDFGGNSALDRKTGHNFVIEYSMPGKQKTPVLILANTAYIGNCSLCRKLETLNFIKF